MEKVLNETESALWLENYHLKEMIRYLHQNSREELLIHKRHLEYNIQDNIKFGRPEWRTEVDTKCLAICLNLLEIQERQNNP